MNPARKTIEVTRDDIWNGEPRDASNCPISKALRRQFPGRVISVFHDYAHVGEYWARMPDVASDFVTSFDTMGKLRCLKSPFTFSLEFVQHWPQKSEDYIQDPYYDSVMEEQAR